MRIARHLLASTPFDTLVPVTDVPETRYTRSGDVNIAYQITGDGPRDLVFVPGFISNVDLMWQTPASARFLRRLASFSRLIIFDKRGTGLSDRVSEDRLPTLQDRMDDIGAVMDAAGSERAWVLGLSEGGQNGALFAATYPERAIGLILLASTPHARTGSHVAFEDETTIIPIAADDLAARWGKGEMADLWMPSVAHIPEARATLASVERQSATPGAIRGLLQIILNSDVRDVLPTIRVPTLVVHRESDAFVHVGAARYMAAKIPGARLVIAPGADHLPWVGDVDVILDAIEEFVTGERPRVEVDRVLSTVVFTDIVGSTERAVSSGDKRWRELLDQHDEVVAGRVKGFSGRLVKTTGDGALLTFDGPARAIRGACAIRDAVRGLGIDVRAGIHTGEIELRGTDVGGVAVHIGQRVSSLAGPSEVLVSQTVKDLVYGSGIGFRDRGAHELKGVPGQWQVYEVLN